MKYKDFYSLLSHCTDVDGLPGHCRQCSGRGRKWRLFFSVKGFIWRFCYVLLTESVDNFEHKLEKNLPVPQGL